MPLYLTHILTAATSGLLFGVLFQKTIITLAHRYKIFAKPDQRRRHEKETPSVGGVGVICSWFVGLLVYSLLEPNWLPTHMASTCTLILGVLILLALGLWDDLIQLGPYPKLIVQSGVAIGILAFEPNIHTLMGHWEQTIGVTSWGFGFLWIVGITNSINLIDGIDGLASGMSILAGISILILSTWSGDYALNATIYVAALLPALVAFLFFNWNPAKVFLGDNGSLPIGMLLSSASLMGYAQSKSWVMVLSLALIFGYPILDVVICILRRYKHRQPFFKGDRAHLHFRIIKLGLTVRQTTGLLLVIGLYLQISALAINLLEPATATLGLTLVFFSIFSLLFLIRSIETWKVNKVFTYIQKHRQSGHSDQVRTQWTLTVDLAPLLEKSTSYIKTSQTIRSLESLLRTLIRDTDAMILSDKKIMIVFHDATLDDETAERIQKRFQSKIDQFIQLYNIECSTATLPIDIKQQIVVKHKQTDETDNPTALGA